MGEDFEKKYALLKEAIVLALVELEAVGRKEKEIITRTKKILDAALDGSGTEGLETARIIAEQYKKLHPERTTTDFDATPTVESMTEQERDSADMVWNYPTKKERE